ncbi:MAG: hypothetical protein ACI9FD_003621 [Gammaproteobacteria bacterium]|jgi:hypothetical protein
MNISRAWNYLLTGAVFVAVNLMLAVSVPVNAASDCANTPWQPKNGRTCASVGLDSNRAVCRAGDQFAMFCDDTKTQVRFCKSDQLCPGVTDDLRCPKKIRKADKSKRACNTWREGYAKGLEDRHASRPEDFERWNDLFIKATRPYFHSGYERGYRE